MESRLGTLNFTDGVPDAATAQKLFDELDYVHAVTAFINGYAAVNQLALLKGFRAAGVNDNEVLVTSGLMDAKCLFLTANADTYYMWAYLDLSKGPLVVETPPDTLGIIDDMWWNWVSDFGFPGADRGLGGKYLLAATRIQRGRARGRLLRAQVQNESRGVPGPRVPPEQRSQAGG